MERLLQTLLHDGTVIEVALLLLAVELVVLRRRVPWRDLVGQAAAGALLLLAVGAALSGAPAWELALLLGLSLPAHAFDVWRRVRVAG